MSVGAVFGLIGGLVAIFLGIAGLVASTQAGSPASTVDLGDADAGFQLVRWTVLGFPVLGLAGSVLSVWLPRTGSVAMGVAAVGMLWVFGLAISTILCVWLLGVGAIMSFTESVDTRGGRS